MPFSTFYITFYIEFEQSTTKNWSNPFSNFTSPELVDSVPNPVVTNSDATSHSDGPPKETHCRTVAIPAIKTLHCGWCLHGSLSLISASPIMSNAQRTRLRPEKVGQFGPVWTIFYFYLNVSTRSLHKMLMQNTCQVS